MRIYVAIATFNRPTILAKVVDRLADQTRQPDGVVIVATTAADVIGIDQARVLPSILLSAKGLCRQRNAALRHLSGKADAVVFFDDDFVPHNDFLANVEQLFENDAAIVGITGELLGDGINGTEIPFGDAVRRLSRPVQDRQPLRERQALYGCNMALRLAAAEGLEFDEALPLYGWQEDVDFTYQLGQRGRLVSSTSVTGIHLGTRSARTPGKRLGYSQVANLVYLWRKGTMQPGLGERLLLRNLAANLGRSLFPEAGIDRRGRLVGNVLALLDLARGRIDPRRVEHL